MQLLLALLAILFISAPAFARTDNESDCSWMLDASYAEASAPERHQKIRDHFSHSPRLLFEEPAETEPKQSMEFYASNEFDWARGKADYTPTDVVLGFASNNVWDVAVRRNAKIMIIGDIVGGPLMAQEYVLRPIFELAKTRAEFLSLVRGIEVTGVDPTASPAKIFTDSFASMADHDETSDKFVTGILEKVAKHPKFGASYAAVMGHYYLTVEEMIEAGHRPGGGFIFATPFSPVPFPGRRGHVVGDLLGYYWQRYSPERWLRDGVAIPIEASNPMYSFMSSEEAYQRLRNFFVEDRVYFVRSDFVNQHIYESVAHLMHEKKLTTITISTSNIVDVITAEDGDPHKIYEDFVRATTATLAQAGLKGTVPFLQTRGWQPPHNFETHQIELGAPATALEFKPWEASPPEFMSGILQKFMDNF